MTRLCGCGPTRERVSYAIPHGHWKTTTFVAVFRLDGDLPPYSPDFNPIEQAFSKVKTALRRQELWTVAAPEAAFGECLGWITPGDAKGYFGHAEYPPE